MLNMVMLIFAIGFLACVLATPPATKIAAWIGAIDCPDQFRKLHSRGVPRLGGLALATGVIAALLPIVFGSYLRDWAGFAEWWSRQWAVAIAAACVVAIGVVDDARGLRPRTKLLGEIGAILILYLGGIRIEGVSFLGASIPLSAPFQVSALGARFTVDLVCFGVTTLWFLGCMNVWNLIDGMDGLASGVGLLVGGTLMLVALYRENYGSAVMAAALVGSLAGFLLYNWHPACVFLGDCGALLIGLLIGVIGVQDSLKGTTAVSILFPLLAMGLPICDTAMAIVRRKIRDLPVSAPDRRHVHHLLIGLGLGPRLAAVVLYFFTVGLCGMVLLGVAWNSEFLALLLGICGSIAFLLVLLSRRDELESLWREYRARQARRRQESAAASVAWEAIQRIELSESLEQIWNWLEPASRELGCNHLALCSRDFEATQFETTRDASERPTTNALVAATTFRTANNVEIRVEIASRDGNPRGVEPDIAFRAMERVTRSVATRVEGLRGSAAADSHAIWSEIAPGRAGRLFSRLARRRGRRGSTATGSHGAA